MFVFYSVCLSHRPAGDGKPRLGYCKCGRGCGLTVRRPEVSRLCRNVDALRKKRSR